MSIALPRTAVDYLQAINAAAIYVAEPLTVGAASIPTLKRLKGLTWIVWVQRLDDAERIAAATQQGSLPEIIGAIEQQAQALNIPLTQHAKAIERARQLSQRLDVILQGMRETGALKAFNVCYKLHRHRMNGHARPYSWAFNELRGEVIRFLANTPHDRMSPALLHARLHDRFNWYVWYQ